jgi:hypothetical protein
MPTARTSVATARNSAQDTPRSGEMAVRPLRRFSQWVECVSSGTGSRKHSSGRLRRLRRDRAARDCLRRLRQGVPAADVLDPSWAVLLTAPMRKTFAADAAGKDTRQTQAAKPEVRRRRSDVESSWPLSSGEIDCRRTARTYERPIAPGVGSGAFDPLRSVGRRKSGPSGRCAAQTRPFIRVCSSRHACSRQSNAKSEPDTVVV